MSKPRTPVRSSDQANVTISLPKSLLSKIDLAAALENRTRSNWLRQELGRIVDQDDANRQFYPSKAMRDRIAHGEPAFL